MGDAAESKVRGRWYGLVAVGLAAAVLVGLLAWSRTREEAAESAPGVEEPGVAHVHGLGIDPGDGALIVATHFGSFRLARNADEAVRIGASYQDTMGFTVLGRDRFVGSGHPDVAGFRSGQPPRLGLIESTDGGESWAARSLSGEADFHGLVLAHGRLYGWEATSGRFMVTENSRDWDTRSTVELSTFAVDPEDAEHVVAGGSRGLMESTDGGRTWQEVDGPDVAVLSWHERSGLWGSSPDGTVWRSDGAAWSERGSLPGEPQAFLATARELFAAAVDSDDRTGIYRSTDGGRTWRLRYRDPAA